MNLTRKQLLIAGWQDEWLMKQQAKFNMSKSAIVRKCINIAVLMGDVDEEYVEDDVNFEARKENDKTT